MVNIMKFSTYQFLVLCLVAVLITPVTAHAFKLVPMSVKMTPSGRGASETFIVDNNAAKPIAVEMKLFVRSMTEEGEDILTESEDDFVVFPAQMIVMPGQSQSVRLQWIGPEPDKELAYRLVAEQLPLSLEEEVIDGGRINVLFRYVASVYILPKRRLQADVKVTSAYVEEGNRDDDSNSLIIIAHNGGTKHTILRDPALTIKTPTNEIILKTEQLPGLAGANILVGHTRKFMLPKPAGLHTGSLEVELQFYGKR
jgi:fimbrial chaperone protein